MTASATVELGSANAATLNATNAARRFRMSGIPFQFHQKAVGVAEAQQLFIVRGQDLDTHSLKFIWNHSRHAYTNMMDAGHLSGRRLFQSQPGLGYAEPHPRRIPRPGR